MNHQTKESQQPPVHSNKYRKAYRMDSGYAWVIVVGCFFLQSACYGLPLAFEVFAQHYLTVDFPKETHKSINLIPTLCLILTGVLSSVAGTLMEILGFRLLISIGIALVVVSNILASFCNEVWQLIMTQGIIMGIGCSCLYIPSTAIVSQWFDKKKGLAYGIVSAGSSFGTLIFDVLNQYTLKNMGSKLTLQINALILLIVLSICLLILKPNPNFATQKKASFDSRQVLNYRFFLWSMVMLSFAVSYPTTLLFLKGQIEHNGHSQEKAVLVTSIMNAVSAGGRIVVGVIADSIGYVRTYTICNIMAILCHIPLFLATKDMWKYMVYAVVFGFSTGGLIGSFGSVVIELFGLKNIGSIMGLSYAPTAIGEAIGPISASVLLDKIKDYTYVNIDTTGFMCVSLVCFVLIKLTKQ